MYGYLKADVKAIVNDIVDELAKEERVAECYQAWLKSREEIQHYYKDSEIEMICKFRLIRPHIPLRTDQPFRM